MKKIIATLGLWSAMACAFAQTFINPILISPQIQNGRGTGTFLHFPTATSNPATCTVGDLYFKSNATAGSNLLGCTATNTWTTQGAGGSGTVTSVSVVTANGISGTVATATTTPAITLIPTASLPVNVTWAGAPWQSIVLQRLPAIAVVPRSITAHSGTTAIASEYVEAIGPISIQEGNWVNAGTLGLTSIEFPDVDYTPNITIASAFKLTTFSMPKLRFTQLINITFGQGGGSTSVLTTLNFPLLQEVSGTVTIGAGNVSLATLSFPELLSVGAFVTTNNTAVTTLSLPKLADIPGGLSITNSSSLASVSLPLARRFGGTLTLSTMAALTTISLPSVVEYSNAPALITSNGSIANVTMGTIGTLKRFGGNISLAGQALTQTSVDNLLCLLASLDGTGGTTIYAGTVTLTGGTNSTPSASGLTCKATIITNGGTVTNN